MAESVRLRAARVLLYVPHRFAAAEFAADYTDAVIDAALPVIEAAGGGRFTVLCTTIRAVNQRGRAPARGIRTARNLPISH